MPAGSLVPPTVARPDLDEAPALLFELDRFGEGPVRGALDLLAVDLDLGSGIAVALDDEDTTVGFHVLQVKRGRRFVLFAHSGAEGGHPELPRLAPGPLHAALVEGRHPPLEGTL